MVLHTHSIVSLDDTSFTYTNGKVILKNCHFDFSYCGFYLVKGPSGSGKSSLLRLLIRLEKHDGGRILFHSRPVEDYDPILLRTKICLLQQTPIVLEGDVRSNLLLPFEFKANKNKMLPSDDALRALLDEVLLADVSLGDDALKLSVGQKQRLCLLRSVLLEPELLLLDEPLSALDKDSAQAVEDLLGRLHRQKETSVIMVSHHDDDHLQIPTTTISLEDGRLTIL
jgi:putative ABC transport system ATP-binding protein